VINNLALLLQFFNVLEKAELRDGPNGRSAHFQRDPFASFWHKEFFGLQIGVKTSLRLSVGVRDVVARHGLLPRQVAYFWHKIKILSVLIDDPKNECVR